LSSFSFGNNGFLLAPEMSNRVLSCIVQPTDLSGLMDSIAISSPSVRFLIDNSRMFLAASACEANCFANNPQPDLQEGLGEMDLKPETIRFVVCVTRDLLEDASIDVEAWILRKASEGMAATINAAILLGDGIGKPMGLLNPNSRIPICQVSPATAPGQFSWQDLLMLKYEIPMQWQDGCSYLMNQRTFALLQTMSSAEGRPLFGPMGTNTPGTGFQFGGAPVHIASQMPDDSTWIDPSGLRQLEADLPDRLAKEYDDDGRSIFSGFLQFVQIRSSRGGRLHVPEFCQAPSRPMSEASECLLGALTLTVIKHLGDNAVVVAEDDTLCPEWRMARIGDVALLEKPADDRLPKRIDCYQVAEHSASGAAFKLDPARLVYSLRWKHNALPPDYEMVLVQDEPVGWVNIANLTLLGKLRRRAPEAVDWAGLTAAGIVQMLDDFEAARDSQTARHH